MHMNAILRIAAILQASFDAKLATDKSRLVEDLQVEFPDIARETLVELVEHAIRTIGGVAA